MSNKNQKEHKDNQNCSTFVVSFLTAIFFMEISAFIKIGYYLFLCLTASFVIYYTTVDIQSMIGRESSDCGNSLPLPLLSDTQLLIYCLIRFTIIGFIFGFCLYFYQKSEFKAALKLAVCAWVFMLFCLWLEGTYMYVAY